MKQFFLRVSFFPELIISGLFIIAYIIKIYFPGLVLFQVPLVSYANSVTNIFVYLIPIIVAISLLAQWSYYASFENLLRKGTFTLVILIPLFILWGDQEFTFWLSSVHLLSSIITLYEPLVKENMSQKGSRFTPGVNNEFFWGFSPPQIVIFTFFLLIFIGTALLTLPISTLKEVDLIDHLFIITSAACVTGLSTLDIGTHYTTFGQLVILGVVQIGGLGIMTLSTSLGIFMGRSMAVKERLVVQDILDITNLDQMADLVLDILKITAILEIIGAVLLTGVFVHSGMDFAKSLYFGVFHSVSAFCNAGLSLFPNNLEGYTTNVVLNFTVSMLVILGGIGFWVIKDVIYCFKTNKNYKLGITDLSLHSKIAISTSLILIFAGALIFFISEYMSVLYPYNLTEKLMISLFHSVSARTAGYNTVPMSSITSQALFTLIILMFIGASPGSTGGGIKTTTFAILWQSVRATLSGKGQVEFFKRAIDSFIVVKSIALTFVSLGLVCVFTIMLIKFEPNKDFLSLLFEAVSAFGTVGLSTGITGSLSAMGKITIILLMFIGRVGPLTLVLGIVQSRGSEAVDYPKEKVIIG